MSFVLPNGPSRRSSQSQHLALLDDLSLLVHSCSRHPSDSSRQSSGSRSPSRLGRFSKPSFVRCIWRRWSLCL